MTARRRQRVMEQVTVSLGWPVEERHRERLRSISPGITLWEIAPLMRREYRARQGGGNPGDLAEAQQAVDEALAETHVLFTRDLPQNLLQRAPCLRWVQLFSAGADHTLSRELVESPVVFTDAGGVAARAVAEFVVMAMLAHVKQLPRTISQQAQRQWDRRSLLLSELRGKAVGILGLGNIGSAVAHLCRAFDMEVLATRRSATARRELVGDVDTLYPPSELVDLLARSDFIVLSLPLTPATHGLIGERELRVMKPTAYLINVGRGALVDEQALLGALKSGRMGGAALDVFQQEPLPPESELWGLPNVLVSPHTAGNIANYVDRLIDMFCVNLERFLAGEQLLNMVDKETGY
ncbi:MAG: D-2-hydroxyacid dehydrogenase [Chloroflexi bacterium]|nr:D-2-hydroxyacid dehydrogenase [Chloroflexota bacterium]